MRKDIFIVGTRLLGIWQLLAAVSSLAYMVGSWIGYLHPQSPSQEYNILQFLVHLLTGLYLILRTDQLFQLLDRLKPEENAVDEGEPDGRRPAE